MFNDSLPANASDLARPIRRLGLHDLLGDQTEWTPTVWEGALSWLETRISLPQAVELELALRRLNASDLEDVEDIAGFSYVKRDRLQRFLEHPPTLLLGIFDDARSRW